MAGDRSKRVVLHIQDAQAWLARAGSAYQAANRTRGELDLCLAQAEVKHAWELSRGIRRAARPRRGPARKWWPLAACLGAGLALAAVLLPRWAAGPANDHLATQVEPAETPSAVEEAPVSPGGTAARDGAAASGREAVRPVTAAIRGPLTDGASPQGSAADPAREELPDREAGADTGDTRPVAGEGGLAIDLDELERLAHDTLTAGSSTTIGQR